MKPFFLAILLFSFLTGNAQTTGKKDSIPEICPVEFINTFTIGHDGENDWQFKCACPIKKFSIKIYSQFGSEFFKADSLPPSTVLKVDWKKMKAGTYMYVINYIYIKDGKSTNKTVPGTITLIADPEKKGNREE